MSGFSAKDLTPGEYYAYRNLDDDGRLTVAQFQGDYWANGGTEHHWQFRVFNAPTSKYAPNRWRWGAMAEVDIPGHVFPIESCDIEPASVPPDIGRSIKPQDIERLISDPDK